MIDVKQATAAAAMYMKELLPNANDVNWEEVEISDDDRLWYITLSASVPAPAPPSGSSSQLNLATLSELFNRETTDLQSCQNQHRKWICTINEDASDSTNEHAAFIKRYQSRGAPFDANLLHQEHAPRRHAEYRSGAADLSVARTFSMPRREVSNLQFRAEFYNATNHGNFSAPGTSASSSSFGQITSMSVAPRLVQFGLKYLF